jgi:DNA polymerase-3 subunit epsilon
MMDFVAFDLETTGTQPLEDGIVEIGAVKFLGGSPQDDFCRLINPGMPIPDDAFRIHGISNEEVKDKPPIQDVMGDFTAYCGDLPLVAHNAKFDFKFLETAVKREKCRAPSGQVLDTYGLAKKVFPGMINYRLETLTKHFDFPNTVFHRASEDAEYCGKVFLRILEMLDKNDYSLAIDSLVQLGEMRTMFLPQFAEPAEEQLGLF